MCGPRCHGYIISACRAGGVPKARLLVVNGQGSVNFTREISPPNGTRKRSTPHRHRARYRHRRLGNRRAGSHDHRELARRRYCFGDRRRRLVLPTTGPLASNRLFLSAIAAAGLSILSIGPSAAHNDPLTIWGNAIVAATDPRVLKTKPYPMNVEDHFRHRLAPGGTRDQEPCSGSTWVYDYVHHIAAGDNGGPETLVSSSAPPVKVPSRDLSHITTELGIYLGDTPQHVASVLHVPARYITRSSARRQFLYLAKDEHFRNDAWVYRDHPRKAMRRDAANLGRGPTPPALCPSLN